ncbi:MAG: LysM peptidoglycan-binding domain-containing protein [Candidatus Saccharibacteria bacterium]
MTSIKHRTTSFASNLKESWKANSKFTIHPFKSLHTRSLLPLSFGDYFARFSLELVILGIAVFGLIVNFSVSRHANLLETKDQSVIFSFIKSVGLNKTLISRSGTTTILAKADQWVATASASAYPATLTSSDATKDTSNPTTIQEDVIVKTNPADTENFLHHGKTVYEVSPGDSIISIASSFGISPQTIMIENKLDQSSILKPGQKLTILPTTGISYTVKSGDTVEGIAKKYNISVDDLLDINDIELPDDILVGDILVVPQDSVSMPAKPATPKFVKNDSGKVSRTAVSTGDFVAGALSFLWPTATRSITQGYQKRHPAVDISNSQKVPIYASEDGIVESSGWESNGFGNTIVINHGNGFKTRYSHASELYVKAGDKVVKGQVIAKQGNTGRVRGVTGIHLDFRIMKNGVSVNPLAYIKP